MKIINLRVLLGIGLAAACTARAATYNWDAGGANPVNGGSGTLSPSTTVWTTNDYGTTGASFASLQTLGTSHSHVFGGDAGTITLGGNCTMGSITFAVSNYIVEANAANRAFVAIGGYGGAGLTSVVIRPVSSANAGIVLATSSSSEVPCSLRDNGIRQLDVTIGSGTYLGEIILTGSNTFSGNTILSAANQSGLKLTIDGDNRLGIPPASPTADAIQLNGSSSGGGLILTLRFTGSMTLHANRGIAVGRTSGPTLSATGQFQVDTNCTVRYDGIIDEAAGLTAATHLSKIGTGTLILGGDSAYAGNSTVGAGTLVALHTNALGTNGTVSVASNATFAVGGGISFTRSVSFAGGSALGGIGTLVRGTAWSLPTSFTVRPGLDTPGILSVDTGGGTLTFGNNTLEIDFDGTEADRFTVAGGGTLSLAGASDRLVLRGTPRAGTYILAQAAAISGTFNTVDTDGLSRADGTLSYQDGEVRLTIPGSGTLILLK